MAAISLPATIQTYRIDQPKLDVYVPVVTGLSNHFAQQHINQTILSLTNYLIHEQGYPQNPQTESSGYYEIKTNERDVLSLSLLNYAYSGGAHGLTLIRSLTFDTTTGQSYQLQDLFKPGSNYVQRLSDIIRGQIEKREIILLDEFIEIRPDQDFYIADKALVIYFQLYELTAYAYGFPYFPISVYELRDMIREDGPLGKMLE